MTVRFLPEQDEEAAYRAHLLSLAFATTYRRQDETLRRGARQPRYRGGPDLAWFARRQELGERQAMAAQSKVLADALEEWPRLGGLIDHPYRVSVACAAPAWPVASTRAPWRLIAAPRSEPGVVLLAALAGKLRQSLPLRAMSPYQRDVVAGHTAASVLVREPAFADHIDELLRQVGRLVFPARAERPRFIRETQELVSQFGDQPPGEIERLVDGMAKGRLDRLHRAWLRDFFVPRGFALKDWVAQAR